MALTFKRILCPVDLSDFSLEGLRLAAEMAKGCKASLYLLHVIDNPFDELYMSSITQTDPALVDVYKHEPLKRSEVLKATIRHSKIMLQRFSHGWTATVPKVRYIIDNGNPFEVILDVAEARRIDLIILATHGRTGIKRLLIGNVAEKVVRHAPCPVLTLKGWRRRRNRK
ncbi:MAG: universal stress protein [Candidatus Binatia bacterium]